MCATQRSGSTLLCQTLAATGVAGRPEEFFEALAATGEPPHAAAWFKGTDVDLTGISPEIPEGPAYSSLRRIDDYADHVRRTRETGTTPNGVFGAKVMWGHLDEAARLAGSADADAFVRHLVGDVEPVYVWVRRFDTARQAVSLWKALQTGAWRKAPGEEGAALRYDFAAIDHFVRLLRDHDAQWERWFDRRGIDPLIFRYRNIAAEPIASAKAVLERIGVTEEPFFDAPPLERQANEQSERWVERYNQEAGEPEPAA